MTPLYFRYGYNNLHATSVVLTQRLSPLDSQANITFGGRFILNFITDLLGSAWRSINPRELSPSFLISFFACALAAFAIALLIGAATV